MKGFGALDRTRTYDPQLRKLMLYPLSYERMSLMTPYYTPSRDSPFLGSNEPRK